MKVSSAVLILFMALRSIAMTKRTKRIKKLGAVSRVRDVREASALQVFKD